MQLDNVLYFHVEICKQNQTKKIVTINYMCFLKSYTKYVNLIYCDWEKRQVPIYLLHCKQSVLFQYVWIYKDKHILWFLHKQHTNSYSNKIMSFTSFFKVNINFKNKIFYTKSEYGCHIKFVVENTMMVTSK